MFLKAKTMAFLGLMLAVTVLLVILSGVFEINTLFFLGIASVGIGIAIREAGMKLGIGFYIAAVLLSFFLAPNKLYCLTFTGIGAYVVGVESMRRVLVQKHNLKKWKILSYLVKFIIYNAMYIPMLIFIPSFIYTGEITPIVWSLVWIAGQALLVVYDYAYELFMGKYWENYRRKLGLDS